MSASITNREIPRTGARFINACLAPFEHFHHEVTETVRFVWSRYFYLVGIEAERDELVLSLKNLRAENARLIEHRHENERLRTVLAYRESNRVGGVTAEVISRDPSNWIQTITINRGSKDGVTPGLAVVDGNAIVGQTTAVTETTAKVLLLSDNASSIASVLQKNRAPGLIEGTTEDYLLMRYVEKKYDVRVGDAVISSGLDGVFPKGTQIGSVVEVDNTGLDLFQHIRVTPTVDIDRLETVYVVLPHQVVEIKESAQVVPSDEVPPKDKEVAND
jgi:rod shape-determining protein MreC